MYTPRAQITDALEQIAQEINYIKTVYNLDEKMLNQLRDYWATARDGDYSVPLFNLVKLLNTKKYRIGRIYSIRSVFKGHGKNVLELVSENV